jgi:hypothetical protein
MRCVMPPGHCSARTDCARVCAAARENAGARRKVAHAAVQRPVLPAPPALLLAAERYPGVLAIGPVVIDDLAVLGFEEPADALVRGGRRRLGLALGADEIPNEAV